MFYALSLTAGLGVTESEPQHSLVPVATSECTTSWLWVDSALQMV